MIANDRRIKRITYSLTLYFSVRSLCDLEFTKRTAGLLKNKNSSYKMHTSKSYFCYKTYLLAVKNYLAYHAAVADLTYLVSHQSQF